MQRLNKSRFGEVAPIRELMPSLPHYLALVVNKAMALEPTRRYQTPGEMLADVETALKRLEGDAQSADQVDVAVPAAQSEPTVERCPRCKAAPKFHLTFENGARVYHCCIICTCVFPVPRVVPVHTTTTSNDATATA